MRKATVGVLALVLVGGLLGAVALEVDAAPKKGWTPTKEDVAASYQPFRHEGIDWYPRFGGARVRAERLQRREGRERLILQVRILGKFDGST